MITSLKLICADEGSGKYETQIVSIFNFIQNILTSIYFTGDTTIHLHLKYPSPQSSKSNRKGYKMWGKKDKTWMDAISVNLFDPFSSQMRMDGGIPDVLIGRWMSVQLWL